MTEVRVALAGVHGHGKWHLRNLRRLQDTGVLRLVGVCDLSPASGDLLAGFAPLVQSSSLSELLAVARPEVLILATPIHTHAELTLVAAQAGVHVLLEKPPAPTLAEFRRIEAGVGVAGVACQVGFQSLGSTAVARAAELVRDGTLGALRGISAAGAWQRDSSYYTRARWAGRRILDGVPVVDGALTNPFAHALATALYVDGSQSLDLVGEVELELWHAYEIDSDDTASLRLVSGRGTTITVAVTLCAATHSSPYLVIHGERGRAVLWYARDVLEVTRFEPGSDGSEVAPVSFETGGTGEPEGRVDLLENLIEHLARPEQPLLVPLASARAFMQAVEAVRLAPAVRAIGTEFLQIREVGDVGARVERRIVPGIAEMISASAERLALFSELAAPWAIAADPPAADPPAAGAGAGAGLGGSAVF